MNQLIYIPKTQFHKLLKAEADAIGRTQAFATLCRINTLYMIKRAGSGHIGSSFSAMDIVSWMLLNELGEEDIFFSSKGHDAPGYYSALLGLERLPFEQIHRLRRLGGLPGHPDVTTPGIVTNTGSLGMGVSKAKGFVAADRLAGRRGRVVVLTGDGELQEGQLWEALASAAHQRMGEITVIVDYNKVQSDTWVSRVNDLGDLEAKFRAFGWHVARCNGHDLAALAKLTDELRHIDGEPKVIVADTVKGKGVSFMEATAMSAEQRLYRFHSGAPDDETYGRAVAELLETATAQLRDLGCGNVEIAHETRPMVVAPAHPEHLVPAYANALVEAGERNPKLVVLDADLAKDCGLLPFEERFPDRFIECGIAEQDMVSQAGALALRGIVPVVHSFACFLTTRPNEQIYNNASERTRVVYVGSLAGLLPSGPGHSHQCVRDIAALAGTPGLVMIEPSCADEVAPALNYAVNENPGSTYLRLVSVPCGIPYRLPPQHQLKIGEGHVLRHGRDVCVIGYGPVMLAQAWEAAELVAERAGIGVRLISLPWLNRVDPVWLRQMVEGYPWVYTLDNHYIEGGQGQMIAAAIARLTLAQAPHVHHFGIADIPACGQNHEVLKAHGLDAESLAEKILRHAGH